MPSGRSHYLQLVSQRRKWDFVSRPSPTAFVAAVEKKVFEKAVREGLGTRLGLHHLRGLIPGPSSRVFVATSDGSWAKWFGTLIHRLEPKKEYVAWE